MCVHKKCAKEADTMTSCTEMMAKNTKKVQTLKQDKLLGTPYLRSFRFGQVTFIAYVDRLAALEAQIENDLFLEPVRVEAYLTLVVNIDDSLLADYKFGIHCLSPETPFLCVLMFYLRLLQNEASARRPTLSFPRHSPVCLK